MGEIKISLYLKLISVWKAQKRVRSYSQRKRQIYDPRSIVVVKAISLLCSVWPYLHDVMDQLEQGHLKLVQSAATWTSFLLKTVSYCNASCRIWNQLTLIQNLDQLLFLNWCTYMYIVHRALSWSNTSWWLVPYWSVKIMVFFTFFLWNNFSWCEVTVRKLRTFPWAGRWPITKSHFKSF